MKRTVAVLYGGRSGEHEISVRSAESILQSLDTSRYDVVKIFITKEGKWDPKPIVPEPGGNPDIDVVFPVLHGTFGEDGTVQGLLELADLPYVGPGVMASSVAMDKEVSKRLCREAGLPVVDFVVVSNRDASIADIEAKFEYPVFVKPVNLGSSVGITKAKSRAGLEAAIAEAGQYDSRVIVERAVTGQEFECSVMGNDSPVAATPCEILPSREFYDYEDKYLLNKSQVALPARVTDEQLQEIRRLAVAAFQAMGCEGMARVDLLSDRATGAIYVNEVNTIPGFTSISMYPKMWEHAGIPYAQLLDRLIDLAIERHARKRALKYTK